MYSQLDPRWANIRMGKTDRTIQQDGCLLCCLAWVIVDLHPVCDPAWLNRWLTRHGGYTGGNRIVFDALQPLGLKLAEYYDWRTAPADVNKVLQMMGEGVVLLEVNATPWRRFTPHWVIADYYWNDELYVRDPLLPPDTESLVKLLPRYAKPDEGLPEAIYRAVRYIRTDQ